MRGDVSRRRALWLCLANTVPVTIVGTAQALSTNIASSVKGPWPFGLDSLNAHPFRNVAVVMLVSIICSAAVVYFSERRTATATDPPPPPAVARPSWAVSRPAELDRVIQALRTRRTSSVGITTGLLGAGGFGKTTLAAMVISDRRVRRRFGRRIYQITVGRDCRDPAAIAAKVNDVVEMITGSRPNFADPRLAGQHLGRVLEHRPRLLMVIDDVWETSQVEPFLHGGSHCARLLTTRLPAVLPHDTVKVRVDQMSPSQARQVLTWRLPPLDSRIVSELLKVSGHWPLLLRLINAIIVERVSSESADATLAATEVLRRLTVSGPAAADDMAGPSVPLNIDAPGERARAVRATIEAGTTLLAVDGPRLFAELGIFAEDEAVELDTVVALWHATAGMNAERAGDLYRQLARLSLISLVTSPAGRPAVTLHDVVRSFLRNELGPDRLAQTNAGFVKELSGTLPPSPSLRPGAEPVTAWWELANRPGYILDHIVYHLIEARCADHAAVLATDLRWMSTRLTTSGIAAPAADLAHIERRCSGHPGSSRAKSARRALSRAATLLENTEPRRAVVDIFLSRIQEDASWAAEVAAVQDGISESQIVNTWPLPDVPDPNLLLALKGASGPVHSLAVTQDGKSIVCAGEDGRVRIWDVVTGTLRHTVASHKDWIRTILLTEDGNLLVSGSDDGIVRLWDLQASETRASLPVDGSWIMCLAAPPDATWLAASSRNGTVQIWDLETMKPRWAIGDDLDTVLSMAVSRDGQVLLLGSNNGSVRACRVDTAETIQLLPPDGDAVTALTVPRTGFWASAGKSSGALHLWDRIDRPRILKSLPALPAILDLAPAADGAWIAVAAENGAVLVIDAATGTVRIHLGAAIRNVLTVAASPDGDWIASAGRDGTVRLWNMEGSDLGIHVANHAFSASTITIDPLGAWVATGGDDGLVRLRDMATGNEIASAPGRPPASHLLADSGGKWLATWNTPESIGLWAADSLTPLARIPNAGGSAVNAITTQEGDALVLCTNSGNVKILRAPTGATATLRDSGPSITAACTVGDSVWISSRRSIELLDARTGQVRQTIGTLNPGPPLRRSLRGRFLAALGRERVQGTVPLGRIAELLAGPDGQWLAGRSGDGTVYLWRTASSERQTIDFGAGTVVSCMVGAPDGTWLAAGSTSGQVSLVDPLTGSVRELGSHRFAVTSLGASPDGRWLVTAGQDNAVRIWCSRTGRAEAMMRIHGAPHAVAWSAHADRIAVAGVGGTYLFEFRPGARFVTAQESPDGSRLSPASTETRVTV